MVATLIDEDAFVSGISEGDAFSSDGGVKGLIKKACQTSDLISIEVDTWTTTFPKKNFAFFRLEAMDSTKLIALEKKRIGKTFHDSMFIVTPLNR